MHSKLSATELTVNNPEPVDREALQARLKALIASNPELLGEIGVETVNEEEVTQV